MKLFVTFIILNIINVILQTAKSIITIKCDTTAAAIANAVAYGLYTVVIIYTNCELSLLTKVIVVALTNFIGVYIVKFFEKKLNKDKLWKFEITIPFGEKNMEVLQNYLEDKKIEHYNFFCIPEYMILNCYCYTQEESKKIIDLTKDLNLKYFVTESKITLSI